MIPRLLEVDVDLRILLFALVVSVGTGMLCHVFPVVQALRGSVTDGLREATGNATSGRQRRRTRSALSVSELALTVVLLTGAGLLFRSLMERMSVEPGFRTENLVTLLLEVGHGYTPEERAGFVTDLRGRVEEISGVRSAATGWFLPYSTLGAQMAPLHVAVCSEAPLQVLRPALQEVVRDLDPNTATGGILTMRQLVARTVATPRLLSILFGTFAGLALLLACGGIDASMLHTVG
jgi:hypothetical protein